MKRTLIFTYGIASYLLFLASFSYFIAFVGGIGVSRTVDNGPATPVGTAVLINLGLLLLFGVQHSVMARRSFKQWWTQYVPAAAERSTFVLVASLITVLIVWQWRPLPTVVWHLDHVLPAALMWLLFGAGWLIGVSSTFLINHFELFGLQQVWSALRRTSFKPPQFRTPWYYKFVRHPMQLGVMIGLWATPHMTVGHLMLSAGMTLYIFIGLYYEERDLVHNFGERYLEYRSRVPKLIPRLKRAAKSRVPA